jgi:acyl-CoA synthetase (AMP-forming)/AMP-acid ligase II
MSTPASDATSPPAPSPAARFAAARREKLAAKAFTARTLIASGMFAPQRPDRVARSLRAIRRWGPTMAAGYTVSAINYPDAPAIVDELGTLTFDEVDRRTNALAHALGEAGVGAGDGVAILCRNHRGFVETTVACSKLGAHALFLNTAFAAPQLVEVCARERPVAIVHDAEFAGVAGDAAAGRLRFVAWTDGEEVTGAGVPTLEQLIEAGDREPLPPPSEKGRIVLLTSGTTGAPKGAIRRQPSSLDPMAGLLSMIPLRARERTMIAAPLFHSWGLAHLIVASGLSSTLVLRRRFDALQTLRAIDEHGATALIVVPVMLQRILELGPKVIGRDDTGSLRVIAASGSALPGELATRVMDAFGDVLYNLYGSTEVAWATIATPADLRAAPGTAGRAPRGTVVRLYDDAGRESAPGERGRVFVGSELVFEGYTGGGGKPSIDGLLASGDIGHLDEEGRLFVDGRDDEMIVSGGENVFPREVEDVIARMDGVDEVAAIAVDDAQFGQRLKAFVVPSCGACLGEAEVKDHVRRSLAAFKVPRDVAFVGALPRNATGKVLKGELAGL